MTKEVSGSKFILNPGLILSQVNRAANVVRDKPRVEKTKEGFSFGEGSKKLVQIK